MSCFWEGFWTVWALIGVVVLIFAYIGLCVRLGEWLEEKVFFGDNVFWAVVLIFGPIVLALPIIVGFLNC